MNFENEKLQFKSLRGLDMLDSGLNGKSCYNETLLFYN